MDINYDAGALRIAEDNLEAIAQDKNLRRSLDNTLRVAKELVFEKRVLECALDKALASQRGKSSYDISAQKAGMSTKEYLLLRSKAEIMQWDEDERRRRDE